MKRLLTITFLISWLFSQAQVHTNRLVAGRVDSYFPRKYPKQKDWMSAIKPTVVLTTIGLYSLTDNDIIDQNEIREERNEYLAKFKCHADDYLQITPALAVYGLNLIGIKGENSFGDRTAILIKSELIMGTLTMTLKKVTAVPRPDTGAPTSFISGHTAQAFAAATFFAHEYKNRSVWYPIAAYTVATSVAALRILNNRHWISDVIVGAGVGILSTNIAYLTHQYKWERKKNILTCWYHPIPMKPQVLSSTTILIDSAFYH